MNDPRGEFHPGSVPSLLRGRFLRNDKRVAGERCTSIAASELGLLRQRQTVSGLRKFTKIIKVVRVELDNKEGFLSRLDSFGCVPASSKCSDTSSNTDTTGNRNELNNVDNSDEVIDRLNDQSEHENEETLVVDVVEDVSRQEASTLVEEFQDESRDVTRQVLDGTGKKILRMYRPLKLYRMKLENIVVKHLMYISPKMESASQVEGQQEENYENNNAEWREAHVEHNVLMDGSNEEASNTHHEDGGNEDGSLHEAARNQLEGSSNQEPVTVRRTYTFDLPDDDDVQSMELRELLNRRSVSSLLCSGFRESLNQFIQSYVERQNDPSFYLELNETSATPASVEQYAEQQNRDQNEGLRDAEVSPLALPSPGMPYMLPLWDQDSFQNETFATLASVEQGVVQQSRDRNEGRRDAEVSSLLALPLPNMPYPQPLRDWDSYHIIGLQMMCISGLACSLFPLAFGLSNLLPLSLDSKTRLGWDIINDLRVDLARMQQRMNNMQRMLGACMEMQLELQRTIRQEVFAALNHTTGSQGIISDNSSKNSHNWDSVRKGICCICSDGNIDSLLYRCGHMCACFNCANELIRRGAKCPMCRAPVIEVIRAYSIQ
ncbi:hypothetical protein F3Y22_tig00110419pilonHSYRG00034 [Hibiscus syriacus]|uniref:RING-type domain-containing protein n=1 Tax=Hibiscus syriacus TaxID=106335 RepID=A0A6A3ARU4_HIBSY|nr:hypothetical protein F3Y22_tig00110419pilonHSYRG00034 [Hibiscus syriacus]